MDEIKKSLNNRANTHPVCDSCSFNGEEKCKHLLKKAADELIKQFESERDYFLGKIEIINTLTTRIKNK